MSDLFESLAGTEDGKLLKELLEDNSNELFGLPENYSPENKEISPKLKERLCKVLAELDGNIPPRPRVVLSPVRAETTVFDSKLGGVPYMPKGFVYPTAREGGLCGKPLCLLAQLNFGTLPRIEGFPEKGILQIFAGCDDDDMVGFDYDNPINQNTFRVIYHENITEDLSQLYSAENMPGFEENWAFPFMGEFLLKAKVPCMMPNNSTDYRFDAALLAACNSAFGTSYTSLFSRDDENSFRHNDEELYELVYKARDISGTAIGGYPYFTQGDPRAYDESARKYDVLLFQLDSGGNGKDEIIWGDCGVANFFISSESLKRLDFSDVYYTWDCC